MICTARVLEISCYLRGRSIYAVISALWGVYKDWDDKGEKKGHFWLDNILIIHEIVSIVSIVLYLPF